MTAVSADVILTASADGTRRAGELLGTLASAGDVVALTGELGAGKTVFAQGVASGLGVVGHVPSPTFNILLVHRAPITLYHFDLYRLDDARQLADVDFYGTLEAGGLTVVEWADRFPAELPPDRLEVTIDTAGEGHRALRVFGTGPRSAELARAWLDLWRSEAGGGRP